MSKKQEIFDKIVTHLRAQGCRAVRETGDCAYLAPDGKRCAAGCLIPPEDYDPKFEGCSVYGSKIYGYLSKHYSDNDIFLIREMQDIHDGAAVDDWELRFKCIADVHGLNYHEPK